MSDKKILKYRGTIVAIILAAASILPQACGGSDPSAKGEDTAVVNATKEVVSSGDAIAPADPEVVEGEELLCLADSKEEAQKIADQYGIELVNFNYGVATFHTEDDPQKVIDMGKEKGYPELSLNGYSHTME